MKRLTVKSEKLPLRCEICHQSDCFNSKLGTCTRCDGIHHHPASVRDRDSHSSKIHPFEVQFWDFFIIGAICFPLVIIAALTASGLLGVWIFILYFTLTAIKESIYKQMQGLGFSQSDFAKLVLFGTKIGVIYSFLSGLVSFTTYCLVRENTRFFKLRNHFDFNDLVFFGAVLIGSMVLVSVCGSLLLCSVLWKRAHNAGV